MDTALYARIREAILDVPAGKVSTYGHIAALVGAPSARMVGALLAEEGSDLPWHRILRSNGTPTPHLLTEQLQRLRSEGVISVRQRVDLRKYQWDPQEEPVD